MPPHSTPGRCCRRWTAAEDDYLRAHYLDSTVNEIAAVLGVASHRVRARKYYLGLKGRVVPWTPEQIATLRAAYERCAGSALDLESLAGEVGHTLYATCIKARKLGLTEFFRPRAPIPRHARADGVLVGSWSADDDEALRACAGLTAAEAAARLGRTAAAVQHRRMLLDCQLTAQEKRVIVLRRWRVHPHPRGARGLRHTADSKKKMRLAALATWSHARATSTGMMSPEERQRRSDRMSMRQATDPRLRQGFSRAASGMRPDLGIYVRSSWEANVARYLKWLKERGEIHDWAYEADTFWFEKIKRGVRSYTPDFRIVERAGEEPHYWEVKGWDYPRGRTALARMARYHPEVRITLIDKDAYRAIAKWKALIPHWETRR